eukprot:9269511-Heterocapsa_arctica.AAC.1
MRFPIKDEWIRINITLAGRREAVIPEIQADDIFACPPEHLEDAVDDDAGIAAFMDEDTGHHEVVLRGPPV